MAHQLSTLDLFGLLGAGVLPPLVWLWFWLKEDSARPEPRGLLVLSFFAGALAIFLVIPLQFAARAILPSGLVLLGAWAAIEEAVKLGVAYLIDFRKRSFDEPIDSMIYLITVALGFASFENVLFLVKSVSAGGLGLELTTALMRFIGATLLHVLSSAFLGGMIALAFCKGKRARRLYALWGLILASVLHTFFNFFIISDGSAGANTNILGVFAALWLGIIILLLFFERIKTIVCNINPREVKQ